MYSSSSNPAADVALARRAGDSGNPISFKLRYMYFQGMRKWLNVSQSTKAYASLLLIAAGQHFFDLVMGKRILILYGSQTGTAKEVAERIWREAKLRHFSPFLRSLDDYDPVSFIEKKNTSRRQKSNYCSENYQLRSFTDQRLGQSVYNKPTLIYSILIRMKLSNEQWKVLEYKYE